jgi:hypothetical protein
MGKAISTSEVSTPTSQKRIIRKIKRDTFLENSSKASNGSSLQGKGTYKLLPSKS